MDFEPKTDEELDIVNLLPEGIYKYKVIESTDTISQNSGNDMIKLVLKIYTNDGKDWKVYTNLSLIKLLSHFCRVNDMEDVYKSKHIEAYQCMDKSGGRVVIGMEKEKPREGGGVYKAKNIVKDYIEDVKQSSQMPLSQKEDFTNDEIPF